MKIAELQKRLDTEVNKNRQLEAQSQGDVKNENADKNDQKLLLNKVHTTGALLEDTKTDATTTKTDTHTAPPTTTTAQAASLAKLAAALASMEQHDKVNKICEDKTQAVMHRLTLDGTKGFQDGASNMYPSDGSDEAFGSFQGRLWGWTPARALPDRPAMKPIVIWTMCQWVRNCNGGSDATDPDLGKSGGTALQPCEGEDEYLKLPAGVDYSAV